MAGGIATIPQVLQLIGQAPNQHGRKTAIENLRAVKSLFPMFQMSGGLPPQMQGLLQNVMQNGPQALLSNPIGALGGSLQGQVGGLIGQLTGQTGMSGLVSALGSGAGLQGALGNLVGTAQSLVGLPGGMGNFDLTSVIGHAGLMGMGVNLPASMGLDRVLGPVFSSGLLGQVQGTVSGLLEGVGDPGAAVAQVLGHVGAINGVLNASTNALTQGLQTTMGVSAFSIVADGLDPTNTDNPLLQFFQTIVTPDAQAAIAAHHEQMASEAPMRTGRNSDGSISV